MTLTGRFAKPTDIERQIAREESGTIGDHSLVTAGEPFSNSRGFGFVEYRTDSNEATVCGAIDGQTALSPNEKISVEDKSARPSKKRRLTSDEQ